MTNIANYDQSGYDYTKYWDGRQYEHEAENRSLSALLPQSGEKLLDLGGSYGRLMEIYAPRFKDATILDYSKLALSQAEENAKQRGFTNVKTVFGSAYELPFEENTFDAITMIRVLHHIEDPLKVFSEVHRVLKPGGIFVLDVANKKHLKAQLKELLKGNWRYAQDQTPLKHSTRTINGEDGIFFNYHPDAIRQQLQQVGLRVETHKSVSNVRIPQLKRVFTTEALMAMDNLIEPIFTTMELGPSVWLLSRKPSP